MGLGLLIDSAAPVLAARLRPIAQRTATVALIVLIGSTFVVNAPLFGQLVGTGAIAAAALCCS